MKVWSWVVYPLAVVVVVLVSANILFGNLGLWDKLSASQTQLKKQAEMATQLRAKVSRLQSADLVTEHQNLDYLIQILPPGKNLPVLLAQIQQAAVVSGAVFESFRGKVGEVTASQSGTVADALQLQVTLQIADLGQLQRALAYLESSLPLLQVKQVRMTGTRVDLVVEGLWSSLAHLPAGVEYAVPDTSTDLAQIRGQLKNYSALPVSEIPSETGVNSTPFQ